MKRNVIFLILIVTCLPASRQGISIIIIHGLNEHFSYGYFIKISMFEYFSLIDEFENFNWHRNANLLIFCEIAKPVKKYPGLKTLLYPLFVES